MRTNQHKKQNNAFFMVYKQFIFFHRQMILINFFYDIYPFLDQRKGIEALTNADW